MLFTGRLVSHKGIDTIIDAVPKVVKHLPDVQFLFTGAGKVPSFLPSLKSRSVSNETVRFVGYIGDCFEMQRLYSLATVFVLPSLFENCPMSLLEAMSCQTPVIATGVGGIPEIVESGRNGFLVPPKNSTRLAESILSLLNDKTYSSRLAKEARQTVGKKFSAQLKAKETAQPYRAVLSRGN